MLLWFCSDQNGEEARSPLPCFSFHLSRRFVLARLLLAFALFSAIVGSTVPTRACIQQPVVVPIFDSIVTVPVEMRLDSGIYLPIIKAWEGSSDTLTWPKGWSGPTIGCGIDLGHIGKPMIRKVFQDIVGEDTIALLLKASGLHDESARDFALRHRNLRLSSDQINTANHRVAMIMWDAVVDRFPGIESAPGTVKTSVLSIAMNRGVYNHGLLPLRPLIKTQRWGELANAIASMPVPEGMGGIGKRRRAEAALIRQSVFESDPD